MQQNTKMFSNTWHKPLLHGPLTQAQELRKQQLQDELDTAAPHLVSVETVRRFKNPEGMEVDKTLRRMAGKRTPYSATEGTAISAAIQRLRGSSEARAEE